MSEYGSLGQLPLFSPWSCHPSPPPSPSASIPLSAQMAPLTPHPSGSPPPSFEKREERRGDAREKKREEGGKARGEERRCENRRGREEGGKERGRKGSTAKQKKQKTEQSRAEEGGRERGFRGFGVRTSACLRACEAFLSCMLSSALAAAAEEEAAVADPLTMPPGSDVNDSDCDGWKIRLLPPAPTTRRLLRETGNGREEREGGVHGWFGMTGGGVMTRARGEEEGERGKSGEKRR